MFSVKKHYEEEQLLSKKVEDKSQVKSRVRASKDVWLCCGRSRRAENLKSAKHLYLLNIDLIIRHADANKNK